MQSQDLDELFQRLREPFPAADVDWRIGQAGENKQGKVWAKVLAYLNNRCIQDRLDAVVGPANWKNEYEAGPQGGVKCGLSLRINDEWITKWDGAENTDIEAVKGGMSDAMKRAAVQWGIGRYLYELGEQWAIIDDNGSRSSKAKIGGSDKWFNWEAPKLPAFALPKLPPNNNPPPSGPNGQPRNGHAAAAAPAAAPASPPPSNGTTPSNGKPAHSENYNKAATSISEARTVGRFVEIRRNVRLAKESGKLAAVEADGLAVIIETALKQARERPGVNPMYLKAVDAYDIAETAADLVVVKSKLLDPAKKLSPAEIEELTLLIDRKILSLPQAQQQTQQPAGAAA